jgi:hypothetical protein
MWLQNRGVAAPEIYEYKRNYLCSSTYLKVCKLSEDL